MIEFAEQYLSEMSGAELSAYLLMVAGVIWVLVGIGLRRKEK